MRRIGVGLIGYGLAGAVFHAPLITSNARLRLRAVVSSRAAQVQRELPGVRATTTAELLRDPDIELVVIATPNATHFDLARSALHAGKHVVVDKPFTTSVSEAETLIALATERGRALSVFHNRRWDGDFLTVRQLLAERRLGTVWFCESRFERFRPSIRRGWREQAEEGSGVLFDLGSHLIDQALLLFGLPEAITADVLAQRPGARVDDYFHVVLEYGRLRVLLHAASLVRDPGLRFVVHGDAGSFSKPGLDPQEQALKDGARPGMPGWGCDAPEHYGRFVTAESRRESVPTVPGAYEQFYEGMAACILEGAPPPVSAREARNVIWLIEAAMRSASDRRTVSLANGAG